MQHQVTIYLWVKGQGWRLFAYPSDEAAREIKERSITIGDEASIGDRASIGKTIFITGSGNTVNYYGLDVIHISCIRKTIAEWQQQYPEVGRENDYSDEQIREYGAYIQMIAELHKTWNIEVPANEA